MCPLFCFKSTKDVFSAQGAWHSLYTLYAIVHGQAFRIITWKSPSIESVLLDIVTSLLDHNTAAGNIHSFLYKTIYVYILKVCFTSQEEKLIIFMLLSQMLVSYKFWKQKKFM